MNGIDISYCQKKVDWSKVTADFAIIRAGYGRYVHQKDAMFESHYSGAKSREIPVGAYWYSYAMSPEEARQEADACLEVLKGKQFEYPIYYDVEEKKQLDLGKEKVSAIIRAFLERVEAAGYWVGLYGSYSSLTHFTAEDIRDRYAIWLAHWNVEKSPYTGQYGMWQYKVGKANGVSGDCDLDVCYVDYPEKIKEKGLNGFGEAQQDVIAIRKGDKGERVRILQEALVCRGYLRRNEIDGDFGVITLGAVLAFQLENGLKVDGVAGAYTQVALFI